MVWIIAQSYAKLREKTLGWLFLRNTYSKQLHLCYIINSPGWRNRIRSHNEIYNEENRYLSPYSVLFPLFVRMWKISSNIPLSLSNSFPELFFSYSGRKPVRHLFLFKAIHYIVTWLRSIGHFTSCENQNARLGICASYSGLSFCKRSIRA